MEKTLMTILVMFLALFIICSKDISIALKVVLIICLIVTEVIVITIF